MSTPEWLSRTELLLGNGALRKLQDSAVAVVGLGGVGGAAAEALCRAGVGALVLVDCDAVSESNLNRQLIATRETLGLRKTAAAAARLRSINPGCAVTELDLRLTPDNIGELLALSPSAVADCIDTVSAKLALIEACHAASVPIISALGTGNRLDPSKLRAGDVADTAGNSCGLSRVVRAELRRRGVTGHRAVFSAEVPKTVVAEAAHGRHAPASAAFVPPAAGFLLAAEVVRLLTAQR